MQRASKKCEKNEKAAVTKLKKAIQQGNSEGARIYAQDAIREKNQALNCLRLGSRIDAVASRLETAVRMNSVTSSMKGVVKGMDKGLASMDVDKISNIMDKFEQQFEDLDVKAAYMDTAMNATTASATPVDQVDELVKMVADENNLKLGDEFGSMLPVGKIKEPEKKEEEEVPVQDDLEARLANLRGWIYFDQDWSIIWLGTIFVDILCTFICGYWIARNLEMLGEEVIWNNHDLIVRKGEER